MRGRILLCLFCWLALVRLADAQPCTNSFRFVGSIASGDPTQVGRLRREGDGEESTCAFPKSCPGEFDFDPRRFDALSFTNRSDETVCVTVELTNNCGSDRLFSAAYLNEFISADICFNYHADGGYSGLTNIYSFEVPPGAVFSVVVHEKDVGVGCNNYALTVSGLCTNFPPPRLSITRATNQISLSWPMGNGDFMLQSASNLFAPSWVAVTNGIGTNGGNSVYTFTNNFGARYFRLRKP